MVTMARGGEIAREGDAPPPWLAAVPVGIAIALLPALLVVGAVIGLAGVGALLARPRLAVYALAFTVPYQGLAETRIQGANVTATEGVILLLLDWSPNAAWLVVSALASEVVESSGGGKHHFRACRVEFVGQ